MAYAVGHNMAGYLPESDVWITSDFEAAKESLREDLIRYADSLADVGGEFDNDELSDALVAYDDVATWTEPGCIYTNYRSGYLAWWINETDEEPEEDA